MDVNTMPSNTLGATTYQEQILQKEQDSALALFNEQLESLIKTALKKNNIVVADADFEQFVTDRLTKIEITGTQTSIIALDTIVDGGTGEVTDIGIKLVEWQGLGYSVSINNPTTNITL